ncbi:SMP-30/gluconolactonase/LRE family protein [Novipirellula maiorica]|uniref:SMP-30/gluconolactonase/LRE family protein n=1 Tax=Novipirellula maiorica TaxID=1265734 RepID=UPI0007C6D575|nr:SMP-30/gluconolactonase/LRE family protein [Rhodopirellula maiorica]
MSCVLPSRPCLFHALLAATLFLPYPVTAQEADATKESPAKATATAEPKYPLNVVADEAELYVVDLDLPGVWKIGEGGRSLFVRGSNLLRHPMNRPRCIVMHPTTGILVGDSATREVYHIAEQEAEPKPLCNARVGIAMALAVSPDQKTVYVGDAEKRSVLRFPIAGGDPELVVRVNARGLAFDADGKLWAVTPDDEAIYRIDVDEKKSEAIVSGRPFQYPNGLVWAGDHGFVTDGYGKTVWKFTADGKTEVWHAGDPLVGPVGISLGEKSLFVADPKQLQVYEFDLESKQVKPRM